MVLRPGGPIANRPLHFFWLADASGSMSLDGKIEALNHSIRNALPHMHEVARENPHASVMLRALRFSHGADWHVLEPMPLADFRWTDLEADELAQTAVDTDVVFLLDTSGSMGDEIDSVKANCQAFADHILKEGSNVRLGLIGFDIGGHRDGAASGYKVHNLSRYTIGVWALADPNTFKRNVQSLKLGLFGGGGCYLANADTVDIFPYVVNAFDPSPSKQRILVIISDEIGDNTGLHGIVSALKGASIKTHVLGVARPRGAHEMIASETGGQFWDISRSKGRQQFDSILDAVAGQIAKEVVQTLRDGIVSQGTDMGMALHKLAAELSIPPMTERALPPVIVLLSDGQPTDDFDTGLRELMSKEWGKRAVRIAIALGEDANIKVLERFVGNPEIPVLLAKNPEALTQYIRWASTAVLKAASSPAAQASTVGMVLQPPPKVAVDDEVW